MTAPKCPGLAAGAVSLRKSHDIVILSFCYIVKARVRLINDASRNYPFLLFRGQNMKGPFLRRNSKQFVDVLY